MSTRRTSRRHTDEPISEISLNHVSRNDRYVRLQRALQIGMNLEEIPNAVFAKIIDALLSLATVDWSSLSVQEITLKVNRTCSELATLRRTATWTTARRYADAQAVFALFYQKVLIRSEYNSWYVSDTYSLDLELPVDGNGTRTWGEALNNLCGERMLAYLIVARHPWQYYWIAYHCLRDGVAINPYTWDVIQQHDVFIKPAQQLRGLTILLDYLANSVGPDEDTLDQRRPGLDDLADRYTASLRRVDKEMLNLPWFIVSQPPYTSPSPPVDFHDQRVRVPSLTRLCTLVSRLDLLRFWISDPKAEREDDSDEDEYDGLSAEVNAADSQGNCVLASMLVNGVYDYREIALREIVALLLDMNADVNGIPNQLHSPLNAALEKQHYSVAIQMIDTYGANLDLSDGHGLTPRERIRGMTSQDDQPEIRQLIQMALNDE